MKKIAYLIDDDAAVRDSLSELFASAGIPVRTYPSAVAFLQTVADIEGGCVVSDVEMPGMTGLELLRQLPSLAADLPVILMTGRPTPGISEAAANAGATGFFPKPIDAEALLAAVRSALALPEENLA
jgi:two-component system response regulator FixJ